MHALVRVFAIFFSLRVARDFVLQILELNFLHELYGHFTQPVILIQLSCCCYNHAITKRDYCSY